jgi:peptide/nickel transport system substrate-binding protein
MTTGTPYSPTKEGTYPEDALDKFPKTLEGVGPWKLVSYNVEEQAVFERNPNYKNGFADTAPTRVIVRYFSDPTQMALAVEKGDINIAWRILGPIESGRLSKVEGLTAFNTGGGGIRHLNINHDQEPFGDKNVRQALAYLVDRDEIIDRVYDGTVTPLYSIVPPGFVGANDAFLERYGNAPDVAKAEELLTASGYSTDKPVEFDLWYPPEHYGAQAAQIFELLKAQLEATPMIKVSLQTQEWGTYIKAILGGEYPIGYLGWFFDWPDTSNYLEPFAQSNYDKSQGVFYASQEMDSLLAEAGAETDQAKRAELYGQAQDLYAEDAVGIPLILEAEYAVFRNDSVSKVVIGPAIVFQYELIELK